MSNDEIIAEVNRLLDQHITGARGYIRQEPYLGDFFRLFSGAFQNRALAGPEEQYITGDGLVEEIGAMSKLADPAEAYQKKMELLRQLGAMWSEWHYAWEMYLRLNRPMQ